jgi:hypothetical protein
MAQQEQSGQPPFLDLPPALQQTYDATTDAAIDRLKPEMSEHERERNERLYTTCGRVFDALGYTPPADGVLVELGMGAGPYLPAVQAAFNPAEHIGIDISPVALDDFHTAYPNLPTDGHGSVHTMVGDAKDPATIPGFESGHQVDAVVALHPNMDTYGKDDAVPVDLGFTEEDDFVPDLNMLTQMHNWQQRLSPNGMMVVTTVIHQEAEALVRDQRLAPFVHLYGVTAVLSDMDLPYISYVVALRATPREGDPIVWTREQYKAYHDDGILSPNENMFPNKEE